MKTKIKIPRATAQVLNRVLNHINRMLAYDEKSHDLNLADMVINQGHLAFAVRSKCAGEIKRDHLLRIAASACGWAERLKAKDQDIFVLVTAERERQRELLRGGKISFDVAAAIPDETRKLRVLVEEIGECAQAVDLLEGCHAKQRATRTAYLREELVQVAAVAAAWLESFEPQSNEATKKKGAQ